MTFILGLYAVLMMVIFPGALFLKVPFLQGQKKLSGGLYLSVCFCSSLLINYFLILFLTLGHLYTPTVMRSFAILEGILVLVLYRHDIFKRKNLIAAFSLEYRLVAPFLFTMSWLILIGLTLYWLSGMGHVFGFWDPSVSYNAWAIEWSQNSLPTLTWHYPQLLSANWSLAYVMIGHLPGAVDLELFPASIQGLFLLGMFVLMLDGFYRRKEVAYLLATVLVGFCMILFYSVYFLTGYADIAVSFFNFAAVMLLLKQADAPEEQSSTNFFGLLFTIAAAFTKPAGLYTAIVIPLLQYLSSPDKKISRLIYTYAILTAVIAPWYVYASFSETDHHALADIVFLTLGFLKGFGFYGRFSMFWFYGLVPFILLVVVWIFKEALLPKTRHILYAYTPYFFVWLLGFGYDGRNLIFFWPVLGVLCAFVLYSHPVFRVGFKNFFVRKLFKRVPVILMPVVVIVVAVLILNFQTSFRQADLIAYEVQQKNSMYDPVIIYALETYFTSPDFKGKVLTNYIFFEDVPALSPYIISFKDLDFAKNMEPEVFKNAQSLKQFAVLHPDIRYFLLSRKYPLELESPEFDAALQTWQQQHKITLKFSRDKIELYELNEPIQNLLN